MTYGSGKSDPDTTNLIRQHVAQYGGLMPSCLWVTLQFDQKRAMACLQYLRLEERYDAAVRNWAQMTASSQLFGQPMPLALKARQRALENKDAAMRSLRVHEQNCSICRRKQRLGFPPTGVA
jgi:hypothetical protein